MADSDASIKKTILEVANGVMDYDDLVEWFSRRVEKDRSGGRKQTANLQFFASRRKSTPQNRLYCIFRGISIKLHSILSGIPQNRRMKLLHHVRKTTISTQWKTCISRIFIDPSRKTDANPSHLCPTAMLVRYRNSIQGCLKVIF